MKPSRIFLDLDDVCNCFTMHALRAVGCPVRANEFHKFNPEWGFDIVKAVNALHPHYKFTPRGFWSFINREVWASAPKSVEFEFLLHRCETLVGRENTCILTTPTLDPECLAGKLEWIHRHFPPWMHRQYLMGPQKHLLARPDALLIDDSDKNVVAFRGAGGQAILMPRPWNSLHNVDTEPHILRSLSVIFHSACAQPRHA